MHNKNGDHRKTLKLSQYWTLVTTDEVNYKPSLHNEFWNQIKEKGTGNLVVFWASQIHSSSRLAGVFLCSTTV